MLSGRLPGLLQQGPPSFVAQMTVDEVVDLLLPSISGGAGLLMVTRLAALEIGD
jgi:hypothetical protein